MRFAYAPLPTKRPVYSLGGACVRPRLIVPVMMLFGARLEFIVTPNIKFPGHVTPHSLSP